MGKITQGFTRNLTWFCVLWLNKIKGRLTSIFTEDERIQTRTIYVTLEVIGISASLADEAE
jgi:uncharacterized membrane protein